MSAPDEAITLKRASLAVSCPECLAEPGEPCYDEGGTEYIDMHPERAERVTRFVGVAERLYDAQDGPS